jgi:hypothetical protein
MVAAQKPCRFVTIRQPLEIVRLNQTHRGLRQKTVKLSDSHGGGRLLTIYLYQTVNEICRCKKFRQGSNAKAARGRDHGCRLSLKGFGRTIDV